MFGFNFRGRRRSSNNSNINQATSPLVTHTNVSRVERLEGRFLLAGDGLTGEYFDNDDLTNLKLTRTDETVNFYWRRKSPDASIEKNTFSVRWTGQVEAEHTERYTFITSTNNGVRLWVNGEQLVDRWNGRGKSKGKIELVAGQRYDIRMEYRERTNKAKAKLMWSSRSQRKQIVPTEFLYSDDGVNSTPPPVGGPSGNPDQPVPLPPPNPIGNPNIEG